MNPAPPVCSPGCPTVTLTSNDPYAANGLTGALNTAGSADIPGFKLLRKSSAATVSAGLAVNDPICTGNPPTSVCLTAAAGSSKFKVYASSAVALQVVLPGETAVPGLGKTGSPTPFTITVPATSFQASVNLVDSYANVCTDIAAGSALQDTNPPAVMPVVRISLPGDPLAAAPASQGLFQGNKAFSIVPRTAVSTYTVVASTDAASTVSYATGTSSPLWTLPASADHFHFTSVPATKFAGEKFTVGLVAHDVWHNVLSTGTNAYKGTVQFAAESFGGIQEPVFSPPTVTFSSSVDQGFKVLTDLVTLKKAGSRWIQAFDVVSPAVATTLNPALNGPFVLITPGAPDSMGVLPGADTLVSAGSLVPNNPGFREFTGQLTDSFNNAITNVQTITVQRVSVVGSPGNLAWDNAGTWVTVGASTQVYTDAQGRVGFANKLAYFVSPTKDDSARIWLGTTTAPADLTSYINSPPDAITGEKKNITGALVTTGGLATHLVFVSSPTAALVGVNEVAGAGGVYVLERRDDFGNSTKLNDTTVLLKVNQTALHTSNNMTLGVTGTTGDYGFRDAANTAFISAVTFFDGFTGAETSFRYHDRMSSYSGDSPAVNTAEGGRPGTWQIEAYIGTTLLATHQLRMDPDVIDRVALGNSQNTMVAGKLTNFASTVGVFRAQLQDRFKNPRIAAAPYTVNLATVTRSSSLLNDYAAFSSAPVASVGNRVLAPAFANSTTTVAVALGDYQTTFYYMDTTASSRYTAGGGTKPVIQVAVSGLFSGVQPVTILPDVIDRIVVSTGVNQTLPAGVTSQAFVLETRDFYGNASPLRAGQDFGGFVEFGLASNSAGAVQFSTPTTGQFKPAPGVARLAVTESATSFYLIDTQLTPTGSSHTLTVSDLSYSSWETSYSTYTVSAGPPTQIGWATAPRRLVAGTTVEYQLNVPTSTVVSVQLRDQFGNATSTTTASLSVKITSSKNTTWVGIDPTRVFSATATVSPNNGWSNIGSSNGQSLALPAGDSEALFYFWDTQAGTTTLTAQLKLGLADVGAPASQNETITPGPGTYLTIHHSYKVGAPLFVNSPGVIFRSSTPAEVGAPTVLGIVARDLFGNIAAGDSQNGQYFTGPVDFKISGSTASVIILDPGPPPTTYHIFTPADRGNFTQLQIQDPAVETLNFRAEHTGNPAIFGFTSDASRVDLFSSDPARRSDGDFYTAGVIVVPTDFAPEAVPPPDGPIPQVKIDRGVTRNALFQGDGRIPGSLDPIVMLRLQMSVAPFGGPTLAAVLSQLKVISRADGNLNNAHIAELALYADANANAVFDPGVPSGTPSPDLLIATGTYSVSDGGWWFGNTAAPFNQAPLDAAQPAAVTLNQSQKSFFLTVRLSSSGYAPDELPASFGLSIINPSFIVLSSGSQVGVASNNFTIQTATSPVMRQPANIRVLGSDIGAWWQPPSPPVLSSYSYVNQGTSNVGFLKLRMWTDAFSGTISEVKVTHTGTGPTTDSGIVKLYQDTDNQDGNPDAGDGAFQSTVDTLVSSATFAASAFSTNLAISNPSGKNGTITTSTRTYFLTYDILPGAGAGLTHGMFVNGNSGVSPLNGNVPSFTNAFSANVVVQATLDAAILFNWNTKGTDASGFLVDSIVSGLTQDQRKQPIAKMVLKTNGGAVPWTGLKLDRWMPSTINGGGGSYNPALSLNNKADDVADIRVYFDFDDNGLFDVNVDTLVSPVNSSFVHNFPQSTLAVPVTSSDVSPMDIVVQSAISFYPGDDPFPLNSTGGQVQRLIFGDDQTDETKKEVVLCYGVNKAANTFTDCYRAQEGSVQLSFSTGTVISGPARIPIQGLLGGQLITTTSKNYFVTFDINPLATVSPVYTNSPQVNLGLIIPNTNYFLIASPKTMSTFNVGIQAVNGGKTVSLVNDLAHAKDFVKIISSDTVDGAVGPYLQQKSTVAVGAFMIQSGVSDVMWRWMLFTATGTATSAGQVASDVDLVSLWYDADSNGMVGGADVLVGTGTFGYGGNGLIAQVNITNPIRVLPAALASQPQRYLVAYHIAADAQPTDASKVLRRALSASRSSRPLCPLWPLLPPSTIPG